MVFTEQPRRLMLRYDPGQFTFRHIAANATDEQLYNLAAQLNNFQECEVDRVFKVRKIRF
jgi:hypothetical protein